MAMPASSSSSIAVDLGEAADLDDATSKLFFHDISSAGRGLSWPTASEIESTLTSQDALAALCSKHGVPSELTPVCAQHLGGWRACTPPPVGSNKLCVYAAALDAGLRFPLHDFYVRVLRRYRLAPSQLTPNAWGYLAAFVLLCQDAGVEPLVSAFRYFFTICGRRHEGKPTGYHHFQPNHDARRRLFAGALPNWNGWKSRFFFLECPSGWSCQVRWGKPKREDVRRVQLTDTVIEKLKEKVRENGCFDVNLFLPPNRQMPVGDMAALAPRLSAVKAEPGAAAGAAAAAVGGAAGSWTTTRKRSRLEPQPLPPTTPLPASAPIRASSAGGGSNVHIPPPGSAPISRSGHFAPPQPQQQSLIGESTSAPAPREVPAGLRAGAQAVGIRGSSEVTPPPAPHTMITSDALQLWEAMTTVSEQSSMITKLNQELNLVKTWNTQWQKELKAARDRHAGEIATVMAHLSAANDRNNHLNEDLVRLNKEYVEERDLLLGHLSAASVEIARLQAASVEEVAQLKAEHAAESAQLKQELAAEAMQLKEELADDAEQIKHEGYTMGARDMKDLALSICKDKGVVISPDELKVELLLDYSHLNLEVPPVAVEDQCRAASP